MEGLIVIIWFLLILAIPLALIVTSYSKYINGGKVSEIIGKLTIGFIVHICLTIISFPFMFFVIFSGAHTKPVGQALNLKERLFYLAIVITYGVVGWLLCSLINEKLIKLRLNFRSRSKQSQSIFDKTKN
jgi:Na+/H+-translocating membrane pyrophosphatase